MPNIFEIRSIFNCYAGYWTTKVPTVVGKDDIIELTYIIIVYIRSTMHCI